MICNHGLFDKFSRFVIMVFLSFENFNFINKVLNSLCLGNDV